MKRHLAVIPARGGSKRLPRKNILNFLGKPIIAYTIEAARNANIFDRIIVSTEDAEIAKVAKQYGSDIDMRPAELASDVASVKEVCIELLDRLEKGNDTFATLTVLYATAPLRTANDIRSTHALLADGACDFAMAVTAFVQPVHQTLIASERATLTVLFPEKVSRRTADTERYVAGNGSTYCVNVKAFRTAPGFYGTPLRGHEMPRERSIDIDTIEDFHLAEFYAKAARS